MDLISLVYCDRNVPAMPMVREARMKSITMATAASEAEIPSHPNSRRQSFSLPGCLMTFSVVMIWKEIRILRNRFLY